MIIKYGTHIIFVSFAQYNQSKPLMGLHILHTMHSHLHAVVNNTKYLYTKECVHTIDAEHDVSPTYLSIRQSSVYVFC